jgi:NAD(P)-dependent dehydrogenase (short-subunit alcohol dehydrogenase family)
VVQKVLITAGATGIGRAMADSFSSDGAEVWVADVDDVALDTCPKEWRRDQLDVTDEKAISKLFARLHTDWGEVNVLCANAGTAGPTAPVEDTSLAEWRRCVSVNLEGAFLFAKYAAPLMKNQKSGVIVLTSSTAGLYGFMHRAPYVSAKWGVIGLMKTLAIELGPFNIRANAICPGGVEGPRLDGVIEREALTKGARAEEIRKAYAAGTSMRRLVSPIDIANMAVFLASDAARLISGQAIAVDGHTEHPEPKFDK